MPIIMKIGWQLTKLLQKSSGLLFLAHPVHDSRSRNRRHKSTPFLPRDAIRRARLFHFFRRRFLVRVWRCVMQIWD